MQSKLIKDNFTTDNKTKMEYQEYRQLRAYSRYDGVYLAILWAVSFAFTVLSQVSSVVGALGSLLLLATPFFVAYRLKVFREEGLEGSISFGRALLYCIRVFFDGALIFAILQWLYMRFVDGGRLLQLYRSMFNTTEMQPLLKAYGISKQEMDQTLQQMFDPTFLASYSFVVGLVVGIVMSLVIAAIMQRTPKPADKASQNINQDN